MSRSTDASKGTPDDDEGRLDGAGTDNVGDADSNAGLDTDATDSDAEDSADFDDALDDVADDEASDSDADESDADESDDDEADGAEADDDKVAAAVTAKPKSAREAGTGDAKRAKSAATPARRPAATTGRPTSRKVEERRGPIAAIVLFVRQVIAELRKVVTPTGRELGTYVAVVIVFVLIVMAYIAGLDFGVGKLILWAFGG